MKKIKRSVFILTLLLVTNSANCQTDSSLLTFEHAYLIMQEKNPSLLKAHKQIEQKEYEKEVRRGLYMPKVSLSANAVIMSDPLHLDLTEVGTAISGLYETLGNYGVFDNVPYVNPETGEFVMMLDQTTSTEQVRKGLLEHSEEISNAEWDQVIQEKNFATVSAGFSWPIFTGGKIYAANKAAGVEINISHQDLKKTEGELLTELVNRYYGLVLANQAAEVMKDKFAALQKHYSDAEKLFEQGIIAKVELLSAKVELSNAERDYKNALRMITTIRTGLNATLAVSESDTCFVPINHLFINKRIPELNYWITKTKALNPNLKTIEYKKQLVELKTTVSKGAYLPNVAIMGSYHIVDYDLSPYTPNWLIGAGLNWTIFDGLSRQKEIKSNKALSQQVKYIEEKAQDDLLAYITKLYNELNNKLLEIQELDNTLKLATEFNESTTKAFNEGVKNSTAVAEAQSKVAQVKALRLKAFYEYDVTLASLLQIAGEPQSFFNYSNGANTIIETIH